QPVGVQPKTYDITFIVKYEYHFDPIITQ
ncbi:MAG: hypothetical protein ACI90V_013125, partial [Bacillariaceae sp.]